MRKHLLLLAATLVLAVACSATDQGSGTTRPPATDVAGTGRPGDTQPTGTTVAQAGSNGASGTESPTTMSFDTLPVTTPAQPADPSANGSILMLKLQVGDVDQAEKFYGTVFGAQSAATMGPAIHIVTFPDGGPGLILLGRRSNSDTDGTTPRQAQDRGPQSGFIMKVKDLAATKARAVANGATEQGTFAGAPAGQNARSVDLLDPWGNNIEILQLG